MTARTLEEIEERIASVSEPLRYTTLSLYAPDLLAIAQGQREEIERLKAQIESDNEISKKSLRILIGTKK